MRLVADMIPWMGGEPSTRRLKFSSKKLPQEWKTLRSAIANWEQKNERKAESGELFEPRFMLMVVQRSKE